MKRPYSRFVDPIASAAMGKLPQDSRETLESYGLGWLRSLFGGTLAKPKPPNKEQQHALRDFENEVSRIEGK